MGCHTWFYAPTELNTPEKILAKSEESLLESIARSPENEFNKVLRYAIDNRLVQYLGDTLCFHDDGVCKMALYHDGVIYDDVEGYHDLFRVGDYPEIKLESLDDTLAFTKARGIELGATAMYKLQEFWRNHPKGLIDFG